MNWNLKNTDKGIPKDKQWMTNQNRKSEIKNHYKKPRNEKVAQSKMKNVKKKNHLSKKKHSNMWKIETKKTKKEARWKPSCKQRKIEIGWKRIGWEKKKKKRTVEETGWEQSKR